MLEVISDAGENLAADSLLVNTEDHQQQPIKATPT